MSFRWISCLSLLLLLVQCTKAQDGDASKPYPFRLTSKGSGFGVQAVIEGTYRVYQDRIELSIGDNQLFVDEERPQPAAYQLSAVTFGLAEKFGSRWKPSVSAQPIEMQVVLRSRDIMNLHRHNLQIHHLTIPINDATDLSKSWLLLKLDVVALDVPAQKRRLGFCYAHSRRDLFAGLD